MDDLKLADPNDLAAALAFALRYQGRKRVHNADEIMAAIVAKRLVAHLERAGFVVMKRPAIGGGRHWGEGLRDDRSRRLRELFYWSGGRFFPLLQPTRRNTITAIMLTAMNNLRASITEHPAVFFPL